MPGIAAPRRGRRVTLGSGQRPLSAKSLIAELRSLSEGGALGARAGEPVSSTGVSYAGEEECRRTARRSPISDWHPWAASATFADESTWADAGRLSSSTSEPLLRTPRAKRKARDWCLRVNFGNGAYGPPAVAIDASPTHSVGLPSCGDSLVTLSPGRRSLSSAFGLDSSHDCKLVRAGKTRPRSMTESPSSNAASLRKSTSHRSPALLGSPMAGHAARLNRLYTFADCNVVGAPARKKLVSLEASLMTMGDGFDSTSPKHGPRTRACSNGGRAGLMGDWSQPVTPSSPSTSDVAFAHLERRSRLRSKSRATASDVADMLDLADDSGLGGAAPGCSSTNEATGSGGAGSVTVDPVAVAAEDYYVHFCMIKSLLESGAVALVRAAWLVNFASTGGDIVLPPREDLPPSAFWSVSDLFDGRCLRRGHEIVAISYRWLSPEHPDPQGEHLHSLREVLTAWTCLQTGLILDRIAIFFDWCSLQQAPRSRDEDASVDHARAHAGIWYAHRETHVWVFSSVPPGVEAYQSRGWPSFEVAVATLLKPAERLLDFGRRESGAHHHERGWPMSEAAIGALVAANVSKFERGTLRLCVAPRQLPYSPKAFARMMQDKRLGDPGDRNLLLQQYTQAFCAMTTLTKNLDLSKMELESTDCDRVAEILPCFQRLEELNLAGNEIADFGAAALAEAVPHCSTLKRLFLHDNEVEMGTEGAERLCQAWAATGKNPFWLWFSMPQHSEFVRRKIRHCELPSDR